MAGADDGALRPRRREQHVAHDGLIQQRARAAVAVVGDSEAGQRRDRLGALRLQRECALEHRTARLAVAGANERESVILEGGRVARIGRDGALESAPPQRRRAPLRDTRLSLGAPRQARRRVEGDRVARRAAELEEYVGGERRVDTAVKYL